jgi:hypothetical protein
MVQLHAIATGPERDFGNVIFIHGLTGRPYTTWVASPTKNLSKVNRSGLVGLRMSLDCIGWRSIPSNMRRPAKSNQTKLPCVV